LMRASRFARRRLGLRLGKWLLYPLHRRVGRRLRVLACGGSALDPDLAWDLEALGWRLAVGYGLTETSPLLTIDPPGRPRPGTVGRPVEGVSLRIDHQAVPEEGVPDHWGEIQARGPSVFQGYLNQPERTREAFTEDGWFRTGDLGWIDDDGYLHVTGRVATLIVTEGGENIQPDELEARYAAHEAIEEIGILQRDGMLVGLIVPSRAITDDPRFRIRQAVTEISRKLPSYQRLGDFVLTGRPLPRTRLGKIKRHELERRFGSALESGGAETRLAPLELGEMSADDQELVGRHPAREVWDLLARRYAERGLTPDTHLQVDLGVDSLAWVNLTIEIGQRTGVELGDEAIGRIETVRDLLREVNEAAGRIDQAADPLADPERRLDTAHRRWLQPRGWLVHIAARVLYALNWILIRGLFRLRITGREKVPSDGPVMLVCNHNSYLDPFIIAATLPPGRLDGFYWAGWTGAAFANRLTRFVSRAAQVIPVDPRYGVRASLALAAAVLERDHGLIWFPEGRRSATGQLEPFRPGIGVLLARYPIPVVPAVIHGTHEAMPPGRRFPRFRRVSIRIGEAVDPRQLDKEGKGEDEVTRIVDALRRALRDLQR